MRKHLFTATFAAAASLLLASTASAAITVSQAPTIGYLGDVANYSIANMYCTFDAPCSAGYSVSFTGGSGIFNGSTPGVAAAPPGDLTDYAAAIGGGTVTLTSTNVMNGLSFYMGSPDSYNSISFYDAGDNLLGTFNGGLFTGPFTNGDQNIGQRISFDFGGEQVTKAVFASTTNSFEFDRIGAAVPEPATWGMMILGFGMVGAGLRLRRRENAVPA